MKQPQPLPQARERAHADALLLAAPLGAAILAEALARGGELAALLAFAATLGVIALDALGWRALPRLQRACAWGAGLIAALAAAGLAPPWALALWFAWGASHVLAGAEAMAQRRAGRRPDRLGRLALGLIPIWGLASHLAGGGEIAFGLIARPVPAAGLTAYAIGAACALMIGLWLIRRMADWRLGEAMGGAAHLAGAMAIALWAFVLAPDLSAGWIAALTWRVAQDALLATRDRRIALHLAR